MTKTFLKAGFFLNILFVFVSSRALSDSLFTLDIIENRQLDNVLEILTSGQAVLMLLFLSWVLYVCFFPPKEHMK
ncbi:MAG: hypothetical protein K2P93_07115 [Alphaproteobacteria bacterium]|nr:hypothetical protein [Alphaproteobacteria bacterium]